MDLDLNIPPNEGDEEALPDLNQPVDEEEDKIHAPQEDDQLGGDVQESANFVLPCDLNLSTSSQQQDMYAGDEVYTNGGVVLPHKEIKSSILKPEIVM
uniref:Uncharacterized protein n=1 Tax=Oryza barthii TaxID=65489 RepID=A0A0D3GXR4_9ORYZ